MLMPIQCSNSLIRIKMTSKTGFDNEYRIEEDEFSIWIKESDEI